MPAISSTVLAVPIPEDDDAREVFCRDVAAETILARSLEPLAGAAPRFSLEPPFRPPPPRGRPHRLALAGTADSRSRAGGCPAVPRRVCAGGR
jgi:hypothetical protein